MTWNPIYYIHYDPVTRELLGGYYQEVVLPDHEYHIQVPYEVQQAWPLYMLTEDMTGVVKNPIYWPGEFPPVEPDPQPEDPPVDPDPEQPVQSGD